jgi:DNA-binding winged helix-turn-helix (wHTH) protein
LRTSLVARLETNLGLLQKTLPRKPHTDLTLSLPSKTTVASRAGDRTIPLAILRPLPDRTPNADTSFGPFRLLRDQRLLLDGETPVRLGGRAYEILAALVERPGAVVTKDEPFARVWPKQFVEEGNLKFHVAVLRKALRDGQGGVRYISNITGWGYCFVAPVESLETRGPAGDPATRPRQLPTSLRRIVGRSDVIVSLAFQLPEHRFITIVGPGGVGKTTVAVAAADALITTFEDGVGFVEALPPSIASPNFRRGAYDGGKPSCKAT